MTGRSNYISIYLSTLFPHHTNCSICTHWRPLCCRVWGSGGLALQSPGGSPSSGCGWGTGHWAKAYQAGCLRAARADLWVMAVASSLKVPEAAAAWILTTLCGRCGRTSPAGNVWVMEEEAHDYRHCITSLVKCYCMFNPPKKCLPGLKLATNYFLNKNTTFKNRHIWNIC